MSNLAHILLQYVNTSRMPTETLTQAFDVPYSIGWGSTWFISDESEFSEILPSTAASDLDLGVILSVCFRLGDTETHRKSHLKMKCWHYWGKIKECFYIATNHQIELQKLLVSQTKSPAPNLSHWLSRSLQLVRLSMQKILGESIEQTNITITTLKN